MHMVSNNTKIAFGILTTIGRHYRAQSLPRKYSQHHNTTMSSLDCVFTTLQSLCLHCSLNFQFLADRVFYVFLTSNHNHWITFSHILICDVNLNWIFWPVLSVSNAFPYSRVIRQYRYRTKEKCCKVGDCTHFLPQGEGEAAVPH